MKFSEWKEALYAMMRDEGVEDVHIDTDLARRWFRDGSSPRDFYEQLVVAGTVSDDIDFDPRYDL